MRAVDGGDQRERVGGLRERRTGMINSSVEILEAEDHSVALAKFRDPRQGVFRLEPHVAGDQLYRLDG
jgi:hypothetical protein